MVINKILVLCNNVNFKLNIIEAAINDYQIWIKNNTNKDLQIEVEYKIINDFQFHSVPQKIKTGFNDTIFNSYIVNPKQIVLCGILLKKEFDVVFLLYDIDKINGERTKFPVHTPIYENGFTVIQIPIFETYQKYAFSLTFSHELMHAWYFLINERGRLNLIDDVHIHSSYDDPRKEVGYTDILQKLKSYFYLLEEKNYMQIDKDLNKLDSNFKPLVKELIKNCKFDSWQLFVTEGYRSSERQNWLYAQGRTRPGKIVTYLKGTKSSHYSGLAVDVAFKNWYGKVSYDYNLFSKANKIAKELGIQWGGDWKNFKDYPHFFIKELNLKSELKKIEGKLVYSGKKQQGKKHYLVRKGKLEHISNEVEFFVSGYKFSDAIGINPNLINIAEKIAYQIDYDDPKVQQAKNLIGFAINHTAKAKQYYEKLF